MTSVKINRRELFKFLAVGTVTTALSIPVSKAIVDSGYSVELTDPDQNLDIDEKKVIIINHFKDKYELPTFEKAKALYDDIQNLRAEHYASGFVAGLLTGRGIDEARPQTKHSFRQRISKILSAGLGASILSKAANSEMNFISRSPLLSPEHVSRKYEMSYAIATSFCENLIEFLHVGAGAGGSTANIIGLVYGPSEKTIIERSEESPPPPET